MTRCQAPVQVFSVSVNNFLHIHLLIGLFFFAEETRIRWVQTQTHAETLFNKISELVNSGVYKAEDALIKIFSILTGSNWGETKDGATEWVEHKYDDMKEKVGAGSQKVKGEL